MTAKAMRSGRSGPQITIAWIGLIGTVVTVMGAILVAAVNNWKTMTPPSIFSTSVVPVASPVVIPSLTSPALIVGPPAPTEVAGDYSVPGQDWGHDCIGSSWTIFPSGTFPRDQNGCLQQPLPGVISTQNGALSLLSQTQANTAQIFGISAVLPFRSDIDMHLTLNQIQTGQIWIGIMGGSDPLNSQGMMMIMSEGDVQNQVFVVRQIPQGHEFLRSASIPAESGGYDAHLIIENGSLTIKINSLQTLPFPLSFTNRNLFVGCRNQFGYNSIDARISDLKISGN